ncbi:hypothetical protein KL86PLE_130732 [uncultured Pleomorphomonas sp.]|uniref:Uncharacterized protein n=1 Tax=uncultured Pleomorphomonas sp. TaxID=442121 RepID=A0A212LCQ7_9HYPH|nr:hypothetical protein KL86PLE_130732 [uncultured Pleomorphomonas sp.]
MFNFLVASNIGGRGIAEHTIDNGYCFGRAFTVVAIVQNAGSQDRIEYYDISRPNNIRMLDDIQGEIGFHGIKFQPSMGNHDVVGSVIDVSDNGDCRDPVLFCKKAVQDHRDEIAATGIMFRQDESFEELDRAASYNLGVTVTAREQGLLCLLILLRSALRFAHRDNPSKTNNLPKSRWSGIRDHSIRWPDQRICHSDQCNPADHRRFFAKAARHQILVESA